MVGISITDSIHSGVKAESIRSSVKEKDTVTLQVEAGQHYRILNDSDRNVEQQPLLDNVVAVRTGNDLILHYADGTTVILKDYFSECEDNACSITLPGDEGDFVPTENSPLGPELEDGSFIIYGHGEKNALMGIVQDITVQDIDADFSAMMGGAV